MACWSPSRPLSAAPYCNRRRGGASRGPELVRAGARRGHDRRARAAAGRLGRAARRGVPRGAAGLPRARARRARHRDALPRHAGRPRPGARARPARRRARPRDHHAARHRRRVGGGLGPRRTSGHLVAGRPDRSTLHQPARGRRVRESARGRHQGRVDPRPCRSEPRGGAGRAAPLRHPRRLARLAAVRRRRGRARRLTFCLEGTAITAGAAITWLRDGLGVIATPAESGTLAASVPDAGGAWAIPAFQGLGTPHMDAGARAVLGGISRATTRAHVVRAMLGGIAWRCREVYDALRADCPFPPPAALRADGGAARNDLLLQMQADALGLPVERPAVLQAAALGAGYLAGLATGVWATIDDVRDAWRRERLFEPSIGADERAARFAAWQRHVAAARDT